VFGSLKSSINQSINQSIDVFTSGQLYKTETYRDTEKTENIIQCNAQITIKTQYAQ